MIGNLWATKAPGFFYHFLNFSMDQNHTHKHEKYNKNVTFLAIDSKKLRRLHDSGILKANI
jgi:hypothetical protein